MIYNNNIKKIKAIFTRGAIWFNGTIIEEINDDLLDNKLNKFCIEWMIYEKETEGNFMKSICLLKPLFNSN